jgi:hypothetical protein
MLSNYYNALQFAKNKAGSFDLAHDAYITWWEKTGNNLFLEDMPRVVQTMKNVNLNTWQKEYGYVSNGKKKVRQFYALAKYANPQYSAVFQHGGLFIDNLVERANDPFTLTEVERAIAQKPDVYMKVFSGLLSGLTSVEIADRHNMSPQLVSYYKKKLERIVAKMLN